MIDLAARPVAPRAAALLTIDVEDWYHVNYRSWRATSDAPVRRVDANTRRILELCAQRDVRGTFFILGCVARDYPSLVRDIAQAGHEIACHGFEHELVYEQDESRFRAALVDARHRLQDASGQPVLGFRAPSWSVTRASLWALDALVEVGFRYDASLFPLENYMYGLKEAPRAPAWIRTPGGRSIFEIPASALRLGPLCVPHGGGVYLRLLPLWFERLAMRQHGRDGEPSVLYVHPREVDEVEIDMPLAGIERFIQGARVAAGRTKLLWLLERVRWQSIREVYHEEIAADAGVSV
jgi:polysaccharide deacetylase family protein (PEP-CTERM system associated)